MADNPKSNAPENGGQGKPPEPSPDPQTPSDPKQQASVGASGNQESGAAIEGHIDRAVERTLRWPESIMSVFTVVIACASIFQCHEMNGQLAVMTSDESGAMAQLSAADALASDTQRLASAAADQSLAASSQAASLSSAAATAHEQLVKLQESVAATQSAANAATAQADRAKEAIIANNRAWLAPHIEITIDDQNRPNGIEGYIENTGHEPAINVSLSGIEINQFDGFGPISDHGSKDICKDILAFDKNVIYPQDKFPVESYAREFNGSPGLNIPTIIHGCVSYETFGKVHFSEFCYWIANLPLAGGVKTRPCANENNAD